ncbi:hypothetical protein [Acidiphilium acidophilum]|uniref:Transposase n=1 Tax=Acidiphilium acidophilum TaxID=76588 RepID=A0AAW9DM76_ACIAO|nr:hypothetical protein [Acidiphilium acidophilum]MDX5929687.1 hypothetical protein [Acidiphilium acidophilum]MEE3503959.1 hypothetical protein [Acidiphilium acidophilum]GBQ05838.1 hypothetical protein AA700_0807 [Acidiphilium acidophilum DSM 700]
MEENSTGTPEASLCDGTAWFDPIETGVRGRIRGFIETMLEEELTAALGRGRYHQDDRAHNRPLPDHSLQRGKWIGP